jgi:protein O-mannosyl-transferase
VAPTPNVEIAMTGVDFNRNILTNKASLAGWLRNPAVLLVLLGALTFAVYGGTLVFQFVWDDNPQIVNNPIIRSWSAVPRVFASDLWYHVSRNQVYYRPLFTTWSTLNYSLFALQPWGWHLGAVLVHILAVGVGFWLVRKLGLEYWTAALSALIFALHPVHIECVAWVSAASDTIVTIFFMLAFIAFLNSRDRAQERWLAWRITSLALIACALLTKEMGLMFSAIVAVYAWLFPIPQEHSRVHRIWQSFLVALPYGGVTLGYLLMRKLALHQLTGVFDFTHTNYEMVLTWPLVLYCYLRILVMPIGLTGLYYTPYVQSVDFVKFTVPLLVIFGVAAAIWWWSRRTGDRLIAFAGLWTVITLVPVLYLRTFGNGDFVRDRYVYLPSVGFVILLAKAIRLLPPVKKLSSRTLQVATICALAVAYSTGSYAQQVYWASELLVFYRGYSLYPDSGYATVGYARELSRRGGFDRAAALLKTVIENHPDNIQAYFSLAETYARAGQKEEGREMLEKALDLFPARLNSEVGKIDVAGLYGQLGDYDRALALCSDVLQKEPDLYSALYNCGNINLGGGNYAEAERLLSRATVAAPDQAAPYYFIGRVYLQTGRADHAAVSFRKAITLDPQVYDYHYWYGRSLAKKGEAPEARREFLIAIQLNHDATEAKLALAELTTPR